MDVTPCTQSTVPLASHEPHVRQKAPLIALPENGISLEEVEKDLVHQAMVWANYNKTKAAKLLNISYDTLRYQVKKFDLDR